MQLDAARIITVRRLPTMLIKLQDLCSITAPPLSEFKLIIKFRQCIREFIITILLWADEARKSRGRKRKQRHYNLLSTNYEYIRYLHLEQAAQFDPFIFLRSKLKSDYRRD